MTVRGWPQALLVEHPALPRPMTDRWPPGEVLPVSRLEPDQRLRIAVQLVALSALLMEFELWPGRSALRHAAAEVGDEGVRAVLGRPPMPLSAVWARLGGGEAAAEALKLGVLEAVAEVSGIDRGSMITDQPEPGFFLDRTIDALLDRLELPLDRATARSLWLLRWSLPPEPEPGDTMLYEIGQAHVARRIGAAMCVAARRRGAVVQIERVADDGDVVVVENGCEPPDLRVVVGSIGEAELAARLDRAGGRSEALVVIGELPAGWIGVRPAVFDPGRLSNHLTAVGLAPARRVAWLERLAGVFDPFDGADLRDLSRSAAGRFVDPPTARRRRPTTVESVVGLAPDGMAADDAVAVGDLSTDEIDDAVDSRSVLARGGRLLLARPAPLRLDPRHAELADRCGADDPRRFLHAALASGDPSRLLEWARGRLDDLDGSRVRRLLSPVEPGALGPAVQLALAEACLGLADVHGARRALIGVDEALAAPWRRWLELLDRSPGRTVDVPTARECRQAPRASTEVGLVQLRRGLWRDHRPHPGPLAAVEAGLRHLGGALRRSVEIRRTALLEPARLDDRSWRRDAVGGHAVLAGLVLFERSVQAGYDGRTRLAARLLRRLLRAERAPGLLAFLQLNLGAVAAEQGRTREAETLTLGAYRLFQAAGFRDRAREAVHNLAVGDLDELRVVRARRRLDELATTGGDLFLAVERARLALATGDLEQLDRLLTELPRPDEVAASHLTEALSLLHGADALLRGEVGPARELLQAGGDEAGPWLDLCAAVAGDPPPDRHGEDAWGVGRTATDVRRVRSGDPPSNTVDLADGPRRALGVALCRHLGVRDRTLGDPAGHAAATVLEHHGLTGWASRLRWTGRSADRVLTGLSHVARAVRAGDGDPTAALDGLLPDLGVSGLLLRTAADGRTLLRVGQGEECGATSRRALELVALGADPVAPAAWSLLLDLLAAGQTVPAEPDPHRPPSTVRIDGASAAADGLRTEIERAAGCGLTVLVEGETGTGKDLVARELHRLSGRKGEFVAVNIAAVPAALLEAELFGSVKGAFTGADRSRRGLARTADGGTLLLDEVGDLDGALQVKLLRFLESGEVRPVGADRSESVDVRVVCATHRDLERRVREGAFREDLFFRIAVVRIRVPALRERLEDVGALRSVFERSIAVELGVARPEWSEAALQRLTSHRWPGNVRELRNAVEVAMMRAAGGPVRPEHLPFTARPAPLRGTWETVLDEHKRRLLVDVLRRHGGNRSAAARELGISRQALLYQLKRLDLRDLPTADKKIAGRAARRRKEEV